MSKLNTLLKDQPHDTIFDVICLGHAPHRNVSPAVRTKLIEVFKGTECQEVPHYDLLHHHVVCGDKRWALQRPDWDGLADPLKAKIVSYLFESVYIRSQDNVFAEFNDTWPYREQLICNTPLRQIWSSLSRFPEFCFLDSEWSIKYSSLVGVSARQRSVQRLVDLEWRRMFRREGFKDSHFSDTPIRTIEEARKILDIPEQTKLSPHVEEVLCRATWIEHYHYKSVGWGTPRIYFGDWLHPVNTSSMAAPSCTKYMTLFYRWGGAMLHSSRNTTSIDLATIKLVIEANHVWQLKPDVYKQKLTSNHVKLPKYWPIVDGVVGNHTQRAKDNDRYWTGRMRFYRTWQYEWGGLRDKSLENRGHVNYGKIAKCNVQQLQGFRIKHHAMGWCEKLPFIKKPREWTWYGDILEMVFEKVAKPTYTCPMIPTLEVYHAWGDEYGNTHYYIPQKSSLISYY